MRSIRFAALGLSALLLVACTPLMRGFHQSELVSDGFPPITIQCSLPLKEAGLTTPFLLVDMLFVTPDTWLAVYGAESASSPMAIVTYSVAPTDLQWDFPDMALVDSPVIGETGFGDQPFADVLKVVGGERDPFSPMVAKTPEAAADMRWLSQRYIRLDDFRRTKIILEYREPLPASLAEFASNPGFLQLRPEVRDFMARAKAAFTVQFAYTGPAIQRAKPLSGVQQRYLGEYLGTLSVVEPLFNTMLP